MQQCCWKYSRAFLLSSNVQRNKEVYKTLTQICICGTVLINCSGFGFADQQQQFITYHYQIIQLFSTTEVNSSHNIVQIEYVSLEPEGRYCHRLCTAIAPFWLSTDEYTFSWKSNKKVVFQEDFSFFTSIPPYL